MVLLHGDLMFLFEVVLLFLSAAAVRLAGAADVPEFFEWQGQGHWGCVLLIRGARDRCAK